MFRMLAHHFKTSGCVIAIVGGHVDHVHLLGEFSRTLRICKWIEVIKTETSKRAKKVDGGDSSFAWQAGYGVFSVSYSNLADVQRHIQNQEAHHVKGSHQDEFRLLCEKHRLAINEQYVWD